MHKVLFGCVFYAVEIFQVYQRVADKFNRCQNFLVTLFKRANRIRVYKRRCINVLTVLYAVSFNQIDNAINIKTLQFARAEDDDIFIAKLFKFVAKIV